MNHEELQSQLIRWMRFPLAVAVVYSHAITHEKLQIDLWQFDYTNLRWMDVSNIIRALLTEVFVRLARPCFFIFSGLLFFNKVKEWSRTVYFNKIKNRIITLMIPFVLWNLIAVSIYAIYHIIQGENLMIFINEIQDHGVLKIFWNYNKYNDLAYNIFGYSFSYYFPYNAPLWFIRDLVVMVFLSPMIYYFFKYAKLFGVIILGIFYCTRVGIYIPGFSNDAFFFFGFGAYFSIHGKNMIVELQKRKLIWLSIAIISLVLSLYHWLVFFQLYIIFGCITLININSYILERGKINTNHSCISFLSKTSFFIFATHTLLLVNLSTKLINIVFQSNAFFFLTIKYYMAPIVCVCLCVGLYYIANKLVPKVMKVLTGNR